MPDGSILTLSLVWFIAGQGWAAASDAVSMRLPNALVLYLLAGAAISAALVQPGWGDLAAHGAVGLAILGAGLGAVRAGLDGRR